MRTNYLSSIIKYRNMKYLIKLLIIIFIVTSCDINKKTVDIDFSSRKVDLGDTINIKWKITERRIKNISIEGITDDAKKEGEISLVPDTTKMYRFIIEKKKDKPIRKSYKVRVNVPKVDYFIGPTEVTDEQYFEVRWKVSNASRVYIEDYRKNLESFGRLKVRLDSSRMLRLYAVNKNGYYDYKTLYVDVELIESFEAPEEIYIGDSAVIKWKFKLAQYVTVDGIDKKFKTRDSVTVSPQKSKTYYVRVHQNDGMERTEAHHIRVLPPTILYFDAPKYLSLGSEATLSWKVRGAKKVSLAGVIDNLPSKGRLSVKPAETSMYKLVIERDSFRTYRNVVINVVRQRKFVNGIVNIKDLQSNERLDAEIFHVDYSAFPDRVTMRMLVVDSKGNFVTGLSKNTRKNFPRLVEYVNKKSYDISSYGIEEVYENYRYPHKISLAIDNSGSLLHVIDTLNSGVKLYISKKLKADEIAVTKFADSLKNYVPLTAQKQTILIGGNFTNHLSEAGSTALYAGVDCALSYLKDVEDPKFLIVFTDGKENASFVFRSNFAATANDMIKNARDNEVKIIWIGYGDAINRDIAEQIAWHTGGNEYLINNIKDIKRVYNELSFINRNYYEITYKPVKYEGMHRVEMRYYNLINTREKAEAQFFIGENFDVSSFEYDKNSYWYKYVSENWQIISPPQAAAFFEFDDSELLEKYKPGILRFAEYMKENPQAKIKIFGHTDLKGSSEYCLNLSNERAKIVKDFIVENGISAEKIEIVKCGQKYPLWTAEDFEWQANENRRIELLLVVPKVNNP